MTGTSSIINFHLDGDCFHIVHININITRKGGNIIHSCILIQVYQLLYYSFLHNHFVPEKSIIDGTRRKSI